MYLLSLVSGGVNPVQDDLVYGVVDAVILERARPSALFRVLVVAQVGLLYFVPEPAQLLASLLLVGRHHLLPPFGVRLLVEDVFDSLVYGLGQHRLVVLLGLDAEYLVVLVALLEVDLLPGLLAVLVRGYEVAIDVGVGDLGAELGRLRQYLLDLGQHVRQLVDIEQVVVPGLPGRCGIDVVVVAVAAFGGRVH